MFLVGFIKHQISASLSPFQYKSPAKHFNSRFCCLQIFLLRTRLQISSVWSMSFREKYYGLIKTAVLWGGEPLFRASAKTPFGIFISQRVNQNPDFQEAFRLGPRLGGLAPIGTLLCHQLWGDARLSPQSLFLMNQTVRSVHRSIFRKESFAR